SDGVELLDGAAVVLKADLDAVGEAGFGDLLVGPGLLLPGQSETDDLCAALRRLDRQAAPAAPDLEQALTMLQIEPVEQQPDLARRASAIQPEMWTDALGPGARKPRRRLLPSGSDASSPPRSIRPSISSTRRSKVGEIHRANVPPPVAKPRSARTRCSPRVLM